MGALLDFFTGGTARIQALLIGALATATLCLGLTAWALVERSSAIQARAERDRALDQVVVVSAAAKACSASVDQAKRVGEAAIAATGELMAAAKRLKAPAVHTVERTERIIQQPMSVDQAADCNWGWGQIEASPKPKAGAP